MKMLMFIYTYTIFIVYNDFSLYIRLVSSINYILFSVKTPLLGFDSSCAILATRRRPDRVKTRLRFGYIQTLCLYMIVYNIYTGYTF